MKLILAGGLHTVQGGAQLRDSIEQKTQTASKATAFQTKAIDSSIVRNKEGEPEQILNIETSSDIATTELAKSVHVYLLPKREVPKPDSADKESSEEESGSEESESASADNSPAAKWANADEITEEILAQATAVKLTPIPTEKEFARDHHFKFRIESDGQQIGRAH